MLRRNSPGNLLTFCPNLRALETKTVFFPKDYYLGALRLFLRMRKQLGCGQQRGGQQLAAGAGNAGEVVAAGREDVRRSFPGAAPPPIFPAHHLPGIRIFSTQRVTRGRDLILSTQRICAAGDLI